MKRVAVDVQLGGAAIGKFWKIVTLPEKTDPMIPTGARCVGLVPHVPLADERGLVTGLLKRLVEGDKIMIHLRAVVHDTMRVRVESRQDGSPAGRTE